MTERTDADALRSVTEPVAYAIALMREAEATLRSMGLDLAERLADAAETLERIRADPEWFARTIARRYRPDLYDDTQKITQRISRQLEAEAQVAAVLKALR